ncbi:CBS domain-containing protein [Nocardiopsis valliformis]|uniref:CBS domain-containing protein n=1 Tax=Nocardiopsis valliformis TaxID=239974 RepID=UPI00034B0570|nr:CBS domain-containing protein [Nocardiopsis valliformis]
MLVAQVMRTPAVLLTEESPIREAAAEFVEQGVICAPVVDHAGELVGIVTEIDLLRHGFLTDPRATAVRGPEPRQDPPRTVGEVMTRTVVTTQENRDVAELTELMMCERVRTVPVVRGGRLVGLVGRTDLLRAHSSPDAHVEVALDEALSVGAPYVKGWKAAVTAGTARISAPGTNAAEQGLLALVARTVPGVNRVLVTDGAEETASAEEAVTGTHSEPADEG